MNTILQDRTEANLQAERAALDERLRRERVNADAKRQLEAQQASIAAARAAANAELKAAQVALNAELDAEQQRLADKHVANSIALAAFYDAPMDDSLSDEEIIELVASTFGMSTLEAIDRLQALDLAAARLAIEVAA